MKKLVLLDTHALVHRAYHALPKFVSKNTGEPTGALYGLSSMLIRVMRELEPDYFIAAFDLPGPTFRHDVYEAYKATRKEAEEDLIKQLIRAHDIIDAFGLYSYSFPGFEADDVLGAIVEQTKELKDIKTTIVSGDMDILQLVDDDRVVVYTIRKGLEDTVIYNEKMVEDRFGFGPELLIDYKGLRGDASDNIKGVPGIGEKTAGDIIKKFGNLENLYEKLENGEAEGVLRERIRKLLLEHKEVALFSKKLATIRLDVPIKFEVPKTSYKTDMVSVTKLFNELGFQSLVNRLEGTNL